MVETNQFHSILLKWVQTLLFLFLILLHHGADAQSTMEPEPTFATHHNWDPSTAVMIGALICAFLFMGFISIYVRHCAESYISGRNAAAAAATATATADRPCSEGIDRETLAAFPILFYSTVKDLKIGNEALECAVCLSDFTDLETLRLLPKCNHVFHPDCIDRWLSSHVTCPVCRAKLNQNIGEVAISVPSTTHLSADQVYEQSSGSGAELCGGEYEEIEQHPVARNAKVGQRNGEEGEGKRNAASKSNLFGKIQRSNSTGHSLDDPGKCMERYTLRLPEDVRRYILLNHGMIQRSASCYSNVAMPLVRSSRKGMFGSDSEGSSGGKGNDGDLKQWMVLLTQPLVERRG